MNAARFFSALGLALVVSAAARSALADAATQGAVQFGAGFRYGVEQNEGDVNPWGAGLGLDLGYTMKNSVYLGGNFEYFFGETVSVGSSEVSHNLWQLSAEGGYDVGLGESIVIRPKLGLGMASLTVDGCIADVCEKSSEQDFMLAPGATLMLLTRSFSLSLDARYAMVVAEPELAKAMIFSLGIGF